MEFGLHLPNSGPFTDGGSIIRLARFAESEGFHSVWLFDHLFSPVELESPYPYSADGAYHNPPERPYFDSIAVMGALAAATTTVRFGPRVLIPTYRHPVVLAKQLATIDALAGGRMILGVGAGWMAEEFEAVGLRPAERFARLDEHVAVMRNAWREGVTGFDGRFYSHPEAGFHPQPPQLGHTIPVIVGGHGDAALRKVARWGDGWAVSIPGSAIAEDPVGALEERMETLRRYCGEEGRDCDELLLVGQGNLDDPPARFELMASMGVDVCDLMSSAPVEQVEEQAARFLAETAPQLR